jgi:hypothetical protein
MPKMRTPHLKCEAHSKEEVGPLNPAFTLNQVNNQDDERNYEQ